MTLLQLESHLAHAHGPLTLGRLTYNPDSRYLTVAWLFDDDHERDEPVGRIDEPGVLEAACESCGVVFTSLVERDGWLHLDVDYGPEWAPDTLDLCQLDAPGAWRHVPPSLFDTFLELVERYEADGNEAAEYADACRATAEAAWNESRGKE